MFKSIKKFLLLQQDARCFFTVFKTIDTHAISMYNKNITFNKQTSQQITSILNWRSIMDSNINTYLNNGELIMKLSDITRIVDPLKKEVIEYKNKDIPNNKSHCFDFWGKNKICDNCISIRAYNDNMTYVKIEYNDDKTYLVTAIPHNLDDRRIVIEVLKDITNSLFLDSVKGFDNESIGIHTLINNMNKLAFNDPLTDLYNRRYIIEKLPVDLLNSALLSNQISVIMADIDFFKSVNDTYGHLAGDKVLKNVADKLSGCIKRDCDWVARYGGEEFLICMPTADLEVAKKTAECMRKSIESSSIEYENKKINVTVSFGICNLKATESECVDDLLKSADKKLYLAKANGRNRIEY